METKKLTAKDLMIRDYAKLSKGNWSEIRQLELIDIEMIAEGVYSAEAIPLTAEILEKNGFLKSLWEIYRLQKTDFSIEHTGGLFILRISNERLCEVKSVSHLQHLLRDFNVDKEIVL